MKQANSIPEQSRETFYILLVSQRDAFDKFYADQIPYFKLVTDIFINGMEPESLSITVLDISCIWQIVAQQS